MHLVLYFCKEMLSEEEISPSFKSFWVDYLEEFRLIKDYFHSLTLLKRYIEDLPPDEKVQYLRGLVYIVLNGMPGSNVALQALKSNCPVPESGLLAEKAKTLMSSRKGNYEKFAELAGLISILSETDFSTNEELISYYLKDFPISSYYATVPWSLPENQLELKVISWVRYFSAEDPELWSGNNMLKLLAVRPDLSDRIYQSLNHLLPARGELFLDEIKKCQNKE
jgi:hypothetical protein